MSPHSLLHHLSIEGRNYGPKIESSMMQTTDTLLVEQCRNGDRDAFAEIVRRYQTLVCSIAYARTGNLNSSEELAQETFVSAWNSITKLHEPSKLRQWLSGIVRNLANNHTRKRKRDVLAKAADIDQTGLSDEHTSNPPEMAIAREEIDLLNRTLASLPEQYREPLVLFYREDQSVARVAELLELSTDNVKQRLSRGRKMLRDEVATLVERGLKQSTPRRAFTVGVLASLPLLTGTVQAATLATTTAKGASVIKAAGWTGILGVVIGPLISLLGPWLGYSMSMKSARSDRERSLIKRFSIWTLGLAFLLGAGMLLIITMGRGLAVNNPIGFATGIVSFMIGWAIALVATIFWWTRAIARIRREDGTADLPSEEFDKRLPPFVRTLQATRSYESKTRLLGLPLISVQFNVVNKKKRRPAIGWIAIGDVAYGVLFACGSIAVGGIAVGAVGIGLCSWGGLGIGVFALGGSSLGYWSLGGLAIGWLAIGGMALAWKGAMGGVAIAHDFAMGGVGLADQANNEPAKAFIASEPFFAWGQSMMTPSAPWPWLIAMAVLFSPMVIALFLVKPDKTEEADRKTPH